MWSKLEQVFTDSRLNLPYSRQGSYAEGVTLPESFFTFWNADTPEDGFFDNKANRAVWVWYVYFYTSDPSLIYTKMDLFCTIAKEKGFILDGRANDISSNEVNYFGRYVKLAYIENY